MNLQRLTKIQVLRESVVKVTRLLTQRNLSVIMAGSQACMEWDEDGRVTTVILPALPDNASDELIEATQGFIDHEVGHVLFTDFPAVVEAKRRGLAELHNLIEDTFIERKMAEVYGGTHYNIHMMRQLFIEKYLEPPLMKLLEQGVTDEKMLFLHGGLMIAVLRSWAGHKEFTAYMSDKWDLVKGIVTRLEQAGIKSAMPKIQNSWGSLSVAIRLGNAMFGRQASEEEQSEQQGNSGLGESDESGKPGKSSSVSTPESDEGQSDDESRDEASEETESESEDDGSGSDDESDSPDESGDGEKPDGDGDAEDDGAHEEDDGGDAEGEGANEEGAGLDKDDKIKESGHQESEDKSDGAPGSGQAPEEDEEGALPDVDFNTDEFKDLASIEEAMGKTIEEGVHASYSENEYRPFSRDADVIETPPDVMAPSSSVERMEESIKSHIGSMMRDLAGAFQAQNRDFWLKGRRRGRLDVSSLHRLLADNDNVYKQLKKLRTDDVDVSLVIDQSGSMNGPKVYLAAQIGWALAEVLSRLGVRHEVITFTQLDFDKARPEHKKIAKRLEDSGGRWGTSVTFSRIAPIYMYIMKDWHEGQFTVEHRRRFTALGEGMYPMGGNVDGESLLYALHRLMQQKGKGKAMIVLSDGNPVSDGRVDLSRAHLGKVTKLIESVGVNLIGIGIMDSSVMHYYKKYVVAKELEELPNVVIGKVKEALLRG